MNSGGKDQRQKEELDGKGGHSDGGKMELSGVPTGFA